MALPVSPKHREGIPFLHWGNVLPGWVEGRWALDVSYKELQGLDWALGGGRKESKPGLLSYKVLDSPCLDRKQECGSAWSYPCLNTVEVFPVHFLLLKKPQQLDWSLEGRHPSPQEQSLFPQSPLLTVSASWMVIRNVNNQPFSVSIKILFSVMRCWAQLCQDLMKRRLMFL